MYMLISHETIYMYVFHKILALSTFEFEINVILAKAFFYTFFKFLYIIFMYYCIPVQFT